MDALGSDLLHELEKNGKVEAPFIHALEHINMYAIEGCRVEGETGEKSEVKGEEGQDDRLD